MVCAFTQCDFTDNGDGTFSGTVTVDSVPYAALLTTTDPIITNWTLTVNGNTYNADGLSTSSPLNIVFNAVAFPCGQMDVTFVSGSCSSTPTPTSCTLCPSLPTAMYVTSIGWVNGTCVDAAAFNGTFECLHSVSTTSDCIWVSETFSACGATDWSWIVVRGPSKCQAYAYSATLGAVLFQAPASCVMPQTLPYNGPDSADIGITPPASVVISM